MSHTLFVSDVHLCPTRPRIVLAFERFLRETVPGARALFILGDLFEYWAGDDDLADPFNARIVAALRAVTAGGTPVRLMHGNRDFLLGAAFLEATGATLLSDPSRIELHGTPTLLMHGDTLCTDDADYQRFRTQVRDPAWQSAFLARPLAERKAEIEALRRRSEAAKAAKPPEIMDVNGEAVATALREHGATRLIHGHTHRPGRHTHRVDGILRERWVLPEWYAQGGFLRCEPGGCTLHALNP